MRPLNILHSEWSDGWGGQEIRILSECSGMVERGHRVHLVCRPHAMIKDRARDMGLTVHTMDMRHPYDLPAARRFARLIRREKFHILHTHSSVDSWLGGWAKYIFRAPCGLVRTRHIGRIKTHALNFVYKMPGAVISVGEEMRRILVEEYGLAAEKVTSIPTGVDPRRFAPGEPDPALMAEFGLAPGEPVVAMVAILRNWKRHDLFCQMAKELLETKPETRFLIVGGGPGWKRVNGYLDEMGLRPAVVMTNHREDVERILLLCDVVVLTSEEVEGASQALSQAMVCERGVVAVDMGSIGDLVKHEETGLLVTFGDTGAMARAVARLLDDPALRREMGRAGRRLVLDTFTRDHMLDATLKVYERVLGITGGSH